MFAKPFKSLIVITLIVLLSAAGFAFYQKLNQPISITLNFKPVFNGEAFELNMSSYPNPGGEGRVTVRDFQFFISNIGLSHEQQAFIEPDSYHLARFDQEGGIYEIELSNVPRKTYSEIEFGIGVDPQANTSIQSSGDLDPNSRMAWNWEVGYKFLLLEGMLSHDTANTPLVYHVGFSENYHRLKFNMPDIGLFENNKVMLFDVNPMAIFLGDDPVDMRATSSVKFDKTDVSRLASQFPYLITLKSG